MMISLALVLAAQWAPDSWSSLPDVPRDVGVGGSVVAVDADTVFVCTGGRGQNFYRYTPSTGTWTPAASLPAYYGVGSGAAMVYLPIYRRIYALAGSLTAWFYEYDPETDTWLQLADYPAYAGDGTRLASMDGRVYAIGGNPFDEDWTWRGDLFYAYEPVSGLWGTLPTTPFVTEPLGATTVHLDNGLSLRLYVTVGYPTREFWVYDIATGWMRLADLPGTELGGVVTSGDSRGAIFALLGQELWRYDVRENRWDGREVAPASIGAGAAMTFDQDYRLYVTRGAATRGFWSFRINRPPLVSVMEQTAGGAQVPIGGTAYATVSLSLTAFELDAQAMQLEVEVVPWNLPFTGVATFTDDWSTISPRTIDLAGCAPGAYRWAARMSDSLGASSDWFPFSGADADFYVSDGPAPVVIPVNGSIDTSASCFASAGLGGALALVLPLIAILRRMPGGTA